jgi:cell division protein FtsL
MTSNKSTSKLELLVKFIKTLFQKKRLIVFIGSKGTTLTAYRFKQTKDTIYIPHDEKIRAKRYRAFLQKHKKAHISFLLDNKECTLKHKIIPILRPMVKTNPIERFITENYNISDIVGYYTYEVNNRDNEIWNNCIASTPFVKPVSDIIEYVIANSLKYNGTYFLSLEFHNIINKILLENNCQKYKDDLQILATITKSSHVQIVTKHKQNILDEARIECCIENKEILLGTIEHAISEKLALYKEYIKTQNLKTCIILLLGKNLHKNAKSLKTRHDKLLIPAKETVSSDEFQDHVLMNHFDESIAHPAFNQAIRSITKLSLFSKILFKPVIVIASSLALVTIFLKSQSLMTQAETSILNKKYYSLSKEYRELQNKYHENTNINDLIDLYNIEKKSEKISNIFSKQLTNLLSFHHPKLQIASINWQNQTKDSRHIQIIINLTYTSENYSKEQATKVINDYVNYLKPLFSKYDIMKKEETKNITTIVGITTLPVRIVIQKQNENGYDIR